jgi:hypothetical protein
MLTEKTPKTPKIFSCTNCDFVCSKSSDYERHIVTRKHINANLHANIKTPKLKCNNCDSTFIHLSSLSRHKKKCIKNEIIFESKDDNESIYNNDTDSDDGTKDENELKILTNLVLELVKSNTEMQKQMIDVCKNTQPMNNTNNINTINSHNKTFNLQVFLNEQCKDAMNLSDFVKSFKLQLSDLELVGDEGFINGMTKVILAKLDLMDANTRPFHCTDLKRETIYVKEDDVWVREGPENSKLAAAIKAIGHQNFFILKEYKALHPDCESTYSEFNDHYMNLIMKSAGCQKEDIAKVIKKLVKEIVIVK